MASPESLRAQAVRLFALALAARDTDSELADLLVARAMALQEQATTLEETGMSMPSSEFSPRPAAQPAQQQQQVQPEDDDKTR